MATSGMYRNNKDTPGLSVIVVGAGISGISATKTLSESRIKNLIILEATDRIGGRKLNIHFGGVNVEISATWIQGVNGQEINPILTLANKINLKTFFSDYANISENVYQQTKGLYNASVVQATFDRADDVSEAVAKFSARLPLSRLEDISVLTFQRLQKHVPFTVID